MGFCPNCGKKTEKGFCTKCRPVPDLKTKDINFRVCAACRKYFYKNKWVKGDLRPAVEKMVKDSLKGEEPNLRFKIPANLPGPGLNLEFSITHLKDNAEFKIPACLELTYCESCSKRQGKYFEGTLQLRKVDDDVLDFIDNYVKQNNFFISEKTETEDGIDLDISNQRKLQALGQQLKKTFGGILKVSIRQFTHNRLTSKQVYRVNVYYESPPYKKGDVILLDDKAYLLTSVRKTVSAIELKTDKKVTLDIEGKNITLLPKAETRITKVFPAIELMDPETFQNAPVQNKADVKLNEKVKVVNFNGLFYIVP